MARGGGNLHRLFSRTEVRENNLFTAPQKKRYPSPKSGRMRIPTSKRVSELQQLFLPSLLPRRVYQSHGYTRVSNLQAASACTQPFGGRCVERCIIRHSRTIRGWYAQTDTGSTANGSGTNFRWCGRVGLAGALLGQTPAACWNLQILIRLYKKDDRSIFSMLLSSLYCLYAPERG